MQEKEITRLMHRYGFLAAATPQATAPATMQLARESYEKWFAQALEVYRVIYKQHSDAHHFETERVRRMITNKESPNYGEFTETAVEHAVRLADLDEKIKRDVVDHINHVCDDPENMMCRAVCDEDAKEYWKNDVSHVWVGSQEFGGTVQIGKMTRLEALQYLNSAVREVNVLYIDDVHHFIFFRTPSIQPSK